VELHHRVLPWAPCFGIILTGVPLAKYMEKDRKITYPE
jgi:hypothetical protein